MVSILDDGQFDLENRIILQDAHGEDIVRSIFVNDQVTRQICSASAASSLTSFSLLRSIPVVKMAKSKHSGDKAGAWLELRTPRKPWSRIASTRLCEHETVLTRKSIQCLSF